MRILVAAVASSSQPSGVCRHGANLVRCLLTRPEVSKVNLVVGDWAKDHFHELVNADDDRLEISISTAQNTSLARNRWYYSELPRLANSFCADVVQATYPVPIRRNKFDAQVAVSLHDLYPYDIPENFGYPRVLLNRLILRQCLHASDAICCVSQNTLNLLSGRWPSHAQKAFRIYNCVEPEAPAAAAPIQELANGTFLLAVAQHRRNKELLLTLRIFKKLAEGGRHPSLKLVIIGNHGPETSRIRAFVEEFGIAERVLLMQGLADDELQWCYRNCALLLSTSTVEGFGLPIAEAVLAGCRVVCSDLPVYREVSRDLCRFVPLGPDAEASFTEAILASLADRAAIPVTLPQFSMEMVASDYLRLYRNLMALKATPAPIRLQTKLDLLGRNGRIQ